MSASNPSSTSPPATPKKPRSPVERTIVWGGILILLVLVAIEFTSKQAHSKAVESLLQRIKDAEVDGTDVKLSDVKKAVGNKVPRTEDVAQQNLLNGGKRVEIYQWFSVSPMKKREMYVYYGPGEDADVLSVSTEPETEELFDRFPPPSPADKEELYKKAMGLTKPAADTGADSKAENIAPQDAGTEKPADAPAGDSAAKKEE